MSRHRRVEDLTVDELRQLLIEKRRAERRARIDHFRRTGRMILVEPLPAPAPIDGLRSIPTEEADLPAGASGAPSKRQRVLNSFLSAIEVLAVIGLIFILFNGMNILRNLNSEVAALIEQPTLTPTPLVMAVVLPSGHTPPNAVDGGGRPIEAEIPEHLRPLAQTLANLPVPTPGPEQAQRLQIPDIDVDAPVVQGDGDEQLKKGVGQNIYSVNPGQNGNLILAAHNDVYGEIFRHLDKLEPGDQIIVYTSLRAYVYVVEQTQIVEPTRVEVMAQTTEPIVTLISCYPYLKDNMRIVVTASLLEQK